MNDELKFHPASMIFPMMSDDETDGLVEDIQKHGLLEAIVLYEGMVLDGRNRLTCCRLAGVKPTFDQYHGDDPIQFVISKNKHRRHLTPSQLAMVAARAREVYDAAAKERMKEGQQSGGRGHKKNSPENLPESLDNGDARDKAGKAVGVSGKSVDYATKVLNTGVPELVKAVESGELAVSTAARAAAWDEEEQREFVSTAKGRPNARVAAYEPDESHEEEKSNGQSRGKGVALANEAIDCLKRIPKNDALRKRGFQIVSDWIRQNK